MADLPKAQLSYGGGCPDCGVREIQLPWPLAAVGDDFDWRQRDYDSFRAAMLEELAARFPERNRWTPADMEVVLVEVLASALDQLADMTDRVASERFLETARQPETVFRFLKQIGYDPIAAETDIDTSQGSDAAWQELKTRWQEQPARMDAARRAGPLAIHSQKRMVTLDDYATRLREHPLVLRASGFIKWGGAWPVLWVVLTLWNDEPLDNDEHYTVELPADVQDTVDRFHHSLGLRKPDWSRLPSIRTVLRIFLDTYRMVGQEVLLQEAFPVGIAISLSIRVKENYFQTEVRHAVDEALGRGPTGFFRPGRLGFGEDLYASDIFETLMRLDGVENVCLNRFKRLGQQYLDQTASGRIEIDDLEIAMCNNDPTNIELGYYTLKLHGGRKG